MTSAYPISVAIADDHPLFCEGLAYLIREKAKGIVNIIGQAANGRELIDLVEKHEPDVVVTDVMMPVMDGIEACRHLTERKPSTKVVGISVWAEPGIIYDMFAAGAQGFLTKNASLEEVLEAIHTVASDQTYYSSEASSVLIQQIGDGTANAIRKIPNVSFSTTEKQLIQLMAKQLTMKEIADQLHFSIRTGEDHSKRIKQKTGAKNSIGIILYALKNGILDLKQCGILTILSYALVGCE